MMSQYPLGFGQWLQAMAYALSKPREIAIVGYPDSAGTEALLGVVRNCYRPLQVVTIKSPDSGDTAVPLLQDRDMVDGHPALFLSPALPLPIRVFSFSPLCALPRDTQQANPGSSRRFRPPLATVPQNRWMPRR
jgi:hypothetical protein